MNSLEKLIADKARIQAKCEVHKQKMEANLDYIHEHGGKMVFTSVKDMIFPGKKDGKECVDHKSLLSSFGVSDVVGAGITLLPSILGMFKPYLFTWGLKKGQSLLKHLFFRKKK
ncbi:MAG: hypothetical protein LUD02_07375 [Tannerellaceae bacterium]|nr:hypothetical protein [Tannerellaceae bacterium]